MIELRGKIDQKSTVSGNIHPKSSISGKIGSPEQVPFPYYDGEYNIMPDWDDITLETEQKSMAENVTVQKIPYHETTNLSGGITVTIGGI